MRFNQPIPKVLTVAGAALFLMGPLLWAFSNYVQIRQQGAYFSIQSNGIPDHAPGAFPNAGNPNRISEQKYNFRIPAHPKLTGRAQSYGHDLFGVALNGVPFDPGTAEFWNNDPDSGWNYEALSGKINLGIDASHAHVQPNGAYHYHGVPKGYLDYARSVEAGKLVGYGADGFEVYCQPSKRSSYQLKKGKRNSGPGGRFDGTFVQDYEYVPGSGDLDECNGEKVSGAEENYRYFLTDQFPFVPRCLMGTADPSFKKQRPHTLSRGQENSRSGMPGGGGSQGRPPRPPQEAVDACQGYGENSACGFESPRGQVRGTCRFIHDQLACVPNGHKG